MRCFGSGLAQPLRMVSAHQVVTRILEEKGGQKRVIRGLLGSKESDSLPSFSCKTFFSWLLRYTLSQFFACPLLLLLKLLVW